MNLVSGGRALAALMEDMDDSLLYAFGDRVAKELGAPELLRDVMAAMTERMSADRGAIFVVDGQTEELVTVAADLPELPEIRVPLGRGIAGHVARTGRVVNIPLCEDDVRFWRKADAQTGYATRTMLAGPLRDEAGELIGVVQVLNKRPEGIFSDDDQQAFCHLSRQVAALLACTTLPGVHTLAGGFNQIVGYSGPMRRVYEQVRTVAATPATVLLRGESGTGKGVFARALHHNSPRRAGPFVHLDCTALPHSLIENELFGHEAGAFTGAAGRRIGKVEQAHGGTLFLDEIGDMPASLQSKLLTVLQDRAFSRLGGERTLRADVRIIAATHRDLETLVDEGRFRQDLYYRLRVVELRIPALRERGAGDIAALARFFVARAARRMGRPVPSLGAGVLEALCAHSFPGNVRELENCLEAAVIFAGDTLEVAGLGLQGRGPRTARLFDGEPTLHELEGRYLAHLLAHHKGNRSACARAAGVGRNTLLRKIRLHGLE